MTKLKEHGSVTSGGRDDCSAARGWNYAGRNAHSGAHNW